MSAHGAELVDIELKTEQAGWVLRVYVEKLGSAESHASTRDAAVNLELCAQIARDLSPALDVADPIPHRYNLEVSSPGVERPLRDERDFARFAGEKARLKLKTATPEGQKVITGILGEPKEGVVTVQDGGRTHEVSLENIAAARLVFEFGPAPKPGSAKGGAKSSKPGKPGKHPSR
ncbi:ribosome maturation factor RimP [Pendulispora brunnea]|uniref:Ribosome maturation factor RimP n=1 Tax=Pendulispora brunnea TaxID=2905690 RepID=A0ABZ2K1I4_9BACT